MTLLCCYFFYIYKMHVLDDNYIYDSHANPQRAVTLQVYEIYNELIKDLLKVPDINKEYLSTDDLPNVGPHVKVDPFSIYI